MPKSSQKLSSYEAKRNRASTNEPFGPEPSSSSETLGGAFVVHLHDARRRHWDLRLELGGVLSQLRRSPRSEPRPCRQAIGRRDRGSSHRIPRFRGGHPRGKLRRGRHDRVGSGSRALPRRVGRRRGHSREDRFRAHRLQASGALWSGADRRRRAKGARRSARGKPAADPNDGIGGGREWLLLKKTDVHAKKGAIVEEQPRSVLSGLLVEELAESREISAALEKRRRGGGRQAGRGRRASDDSDALHVERSPIGSRGVAL